MDIFYYQLKGIRFLGLGREPESRIKRTLLSIYRFLMLIFLFYFLFMYIFFIADNYDDFMEIALSVTSLGVDIISLAKILTFWYYLDRFYELLDKIQSNAYTNGYTKKANRIGGMFTRVFFIQIITAATLYIATPFSLNLINHYMYGSEWTTDMPLKFKSFYDVGKSPAYGLTYIGIGADMYIICFIQMAADSIFLICCMNIGAYFDMLREQAGAIDKRAFIRQHQETVALANELRELYRPVIFVEFLIISIVLCGIGVTFVMARNFVEKSLVIGYGNTMLLQLFIYCYSGQFLMDRTASVCDELYNLDRDYCLVIKRAQKSVTIDAPFFRATLEQFASVLNRTWGLISVLKSAME